MLCLYRAKIQWERLSIPYTDILNSTPHNFSFQDQIRLNFHKLPFIIKTVDYKYPIIICQNVLFLLHCKQREQNQYIQNMIPLKGNTIRSVSLFGRAFLSQSASCF